MATTLQYTRERTFIDWSRNFKAIGPGEYDVADNAVDEYLEHAGWERPAGDSEGDTSSDDSMSYEERIVHAETLVQEHWQSVTSQIESGEADEYLDDLEREEKRRDSPRDSVLEAIADRREQLEE